MPTSPTESYASNGNGNTKPTNRYLYREPFDQTPNDDHHEKIKGMAQVIATGHPFLHHINEKSPLPGVPFPTRGGERTAYTLDLNSLTLVGSQVSSTKKYPLSSTHQNSAQAAKTRAQAAITKQQNVTRTTKVLVISTHPDDEVLGLGGTIAQYTEENVQVEVVLISDGCSSRRYGKRAGAEGVTGAELENIARQELRVAIENRYVAAIKANLALGVHRLHFWNFPDNRLDDSEYVELVTPMEELLESYRPQILYTHWFSDNNQSHRTMNQVVNTATRPYPKQPVKALFYFEVASSTNWQPANCGPAFQPTLFNCLKPEHLNKKLEALSCYSPSGEINPYPHARSVEAVRALAAYRGTSIGADYAEGFVIGRLVQQAYVETEPEQ